METQRVQRGRSRLPIGVWWVVLGPVAGVVSASALLAASALIAGSSDGFTFRDLWIAAALGSAFGLVGGGVVGFVGGLLITILDDALPDRANPRMDVALAMALSVPLPLYIATSFAAIDDGGDAALFWAPVFVMPGVAALVAAWIWRRTRPD